jgi:hypothetical protein
LLPAQASAKPRDLSEDSAIIPEELIKSGFPGLPLGGLMSNFIALIIEDDPLQRLFLADMLKEEGLEVVECASAEAAELYWSPPATNSGRWLTMAY